MQPSDSSTPRQGSRAGYIPTLDGWRALAILMVLVDHALHYAARPLQLVRWHVPPALGLHGVTLFFVLSGYLITSRLLEESRERGTISLRGFYVRRAFRILPAALVVLAAIALLGWAGLLPVTSREIGATLIFLRNYALSVSPTDGAGFFTAHYWSLAVEEHFYLLWPLVLVVALKRRAALPVCLIAAIGFAGWSEYRYAVETQGLAPASWGYFTHTDTRLHTLLWGAAAAITLELYPGARTAAQRYLTSPVWTALVVLYVALWAELRTRPTAWEAIVIALLIVGTTIRPEAVAGRVLEWSPARWLGRLSYSFYLTNNVLFPFVWLGRPLGVAHSFPLNVALTILTSVALYRYVERPMIRLGHRLAPPTTEGRPTDEPDGPRPSTIPVHDGHNAGHQGGERGVPGLGQPRPAAD